MHFSEEEMIGSVSVFHTGLDMFITGVWPYKFAERILRLWANNGRDITKCELRKRELDIPDNTALLIIDSSGKIIAYFHWGNKGYALAFTDKTYRFVKYTPPCGVDVSDVYERFGEEQWNGKGRLIKLDRIRES